MEFTRNLIKFRKENKVFSDSNFVNILTYHYDNGEIANSDNIGYWDNNNDNFFGMLINSNQNRIYVSMSKSDKPMNIKMPKEKEFQGWHKIIDTTDFKNIDFSVKDYIKDNYILNPHALAIFMEK